jgi:uncharacterized damage-inducible protein DinB
VFRTVEDFVKGWIHQSEGTKKLLGALTDASLATSVNEEHRSLARMAWHITTVVPQMMNQTGLKVDGPAADSPIPTSAKAIADAYAAAADSLTAAVKASWTDASMGVVNKVYGQEFPNGLTAMFLITHETHHRGQMTVLMRQAGLRIPGVMGPTKEDWAGFGAPAPAL